jgi:S-adenosylmethionine/arginine decarboxylase-like enzyme
LLCRDQTYQLVDIKNVDPYFLNSEEQLADAMISIIKEAELTLLSYHCHSLTPGVTCIGFLLESHIALHTWYVFNDFCFRNEAIYPELV